MKERPILFSGPMVKAILDGTKTQTRRVVKPQKDKSFGCDLAQHEIAGEVNDGNYENCPYGQPGDRLWVRETWARDADGGAIYRADCTNGIDIKNKADEFEHDRLNEERWAKWRPSIFMPREASRITLEVTGVRVERLQDISEADAIAEGVDYKTCPTEQTAESLRAQSAARKIGMCAHYEAAIDYVGGYRLLWDSINAKTAPWASNPWVWVVEFKRSKQ